MKQSKTTTGPKTLDTLVAMVELAIQHRYGDRTPTLADIARITAFASRCLRINDLDERISCENAAVLALGKKLAVIA